MISRIVFILGAGASKEAGAPLMREFLDVAEVVREQQTGETRKQFDLGVQGNRGITSDLCKIVS